MEIKINLCFCPFCREKDTAVVDQDLAKREQQLEEEGYVRVMVE